MSPQTQDLVDPMDNRLSFLNHITEYLLGKDSMQVICMTTTWADLDIDQLDGVVIIDIASQSYGVDARCFSHLLSPSNAVWDLITAIENDGLQNDETVNFCDRQGLIFICYPGGAGGFALRWILLQSDETTGRDELGDEWITYDGAAHYMCTRYGLRWDDTNDKGINERYGTLDSIATSIHPKFHLYSFYLPFMLPGLINGCRRVFNRAHLINGKSVAELDTDTVCVMSDHIPPRAAREIFPKAKILSLHMPLHTRFRNFWTKNMLHPESQDESKPRLEKLLKAQNLSHDAESIDRMLWGNLNHCKVLDAMHTQPYLSDGAFVVDAQRLFSPSSWRDEYDRIIMHCGLTPNYQAVERFVVDYAARQFTRFSSRR